jgi:two-component system NarL family response regulator
MIRVLIVDDHIVVRLGLRTLIQSQPDMQVAGDAGDGPDAVALLEKTRPDLVLLDLRMPDWGGVEVTRRMKALDDKVRILILSSFGSEEDIYQALHAGAVGYILKTTGSEELLTAIRQVHVGGNWIPPGVAARYAERMQRANLTQREMEILTCIFHGLSNKEIAYQLSVAENTVKNHINNLMVKLGANDRTQATHLALIRGLLSID